VKLTNTLFNNLPGGRSMLLLKRSISWHWHRSSHDGPYGSLVISDAAQRTFGATPLEEQEIER
jgi:hypothetical protein